MEESLIGAMLLSPEAVSIAYETVEPEDFYRPLHAQIFSAILALATAWTTANPFGPSLDPEALKHPDKLRSNIAEAVRRLSAP